MAAGPRRIAPAWLDTQAGRRVSRRASAPWLLALCLAACGTGGTGPQSGSTQTQADAVAADVDAVTADTAAPVATCAGTVLREPVAAFDYQCGFLATCAGAGKCYCGKGCSAKQTPACNAELCTGDEPVCYCGESCAADKKQPMCPEFMCQPLGEITGCEQQPWCKFVNTPPPSSCGCTDMPESEPPCWCGKCDGGETACPAEKCVGKNPDKCIVVPGQPYTGCFCKTCGLLGNEPKCFLLKCI